MVFVLKHEIEKAIGKWLHAWIDRREVVVQLLRIEDGQVVFQPEGKEPRKFRIWDVPDGPQGQRIRVFDTAEEAREALPPFSATGGKMKCQTCQSERVANISGKCSDLCSVQIPSEGYESQGYNSLRGPLGSSDYIELRVCLDCGQVQGDFPLAIPEIEKEW